MPRAESISRNEARERALSELAAARPELAPWLRPLRVSLASLDNDTWSGVVPVVSQHRTLDAALLDGALVPVEPIRVRDHVRAVLTAALAPADLASAQNLDELGLLDRAVNHHHNGNIESPALRTAAQLAAIPLFIACARNVTSEAPWTYGYCHVCGELPVFAELLGLERARQLRCGRCCSAWKSNVLVCPFCGETDHARLGSLVPEGPAGQICWVETCSTCNGYIKTRAALRSMNAESVLIEDARTIDLDLVAAERGFARPSRNEHAAQIRLTIDGVT